MRDLPQPNPRFTGIFIPVEILTMPGLTGTDVILLSWIDALYSEEYGGCFASNAYFVRKLGLKDNTVKILLAKLKKMGLIEQVSFDGRIRVLRACKENWFKKKPIESTSEVDLNQPLQLIKINPCGGFKSTPLIIESKEESKEERERPRGPQKEKAAKAAPIPPIASQPLISFGSHVKLTEPQHAELVKTVGAEPLDELICQMNDYCAASRPKGYLDYAAALRLWIKRDAKNGTGKGNGYSRAKTARETIAERQLADYEKHNGSFDDCVQRYD
jgi:hypothetical protein